MIKRSALVAVAILALPQSGQAQKRVPITMEEAGISLVGDDSFVTKRAWQRLNNRDIEYIYFDGGLIAYTESHPGTSLTAMNDLKRNIARDFNRNKTVKNKYDLQADTSDVEISQNNYGEFAYLLNP